jgi:DNA primase
LARTFLTERGFDEDATRHFGVGFAPKSWDALTTHLRGLGFTDAELLAGGLLSQGARGVYDRFRGRLVWPIRDLGGDVVGFGARRLFEDDDGPKYLNTPETPIYRKSQVLYGLDLARRDIAKQQQVVVVEGYTDVMACHLAGVTTAVATCGTSFASEHVKVIRRLLMDDDQVRGEIVYTFDGDQAGQRAALRAFGEDQRFVARTYVAVEPSGMDPCDLRLAQGDAAVRALIDRRVPLFEFAIRSTLAGFDLNTAEGRIAALQQAAPVVARIKDTALRPEYTRLLAGWLGVDLDSVTKAVRAGQNAAATSATPGSNPPVASPTARIEREALKCALQQPTAVTEWYESLEDSSFTHPQALRVHHAIVAAGGPRPGVDGLGWIDQVLDAAADDEVRRVVRELAVEPLPAESGTDSRYAASMVARLLEMDAGRRIDELRGQLQRCDALAHPEEHQRLFTDLLALEDYRRTLRDEALGSRLP